MKHICATLLLQRTEGEQMSNNLTEKEQKLVERYMRRIAYQRKYVKKNKEEIRRKAKEKYHARKKIIDPETGLSLIQLDQKKYWTNYKKNNPEWQTNGRRATYQKKYREENLNDIRLKDKLKAREPERKAAILNARRLREYGISTEDYEKMLKQQNYTCLICGGTKMNKSRKKLCVDHNHKTGVTRGLLCNGCNTIIGMTDEKIETLENCIAYLKMHNGGEK